MTKLKIALLVPFCLILAFAALPWKYVASDYGASTLIPTDPHALAAYYANRYQVPLRTVNRIVTNESGWNCNAHNGNGEDSWGCAQINLEAHKEVTRAMAISPKYSLRYLAWHLAKGLGKMWTTY